MSDAYGAGFLRALMVAAVAAAGCAARAPRADWPQMGRTPARNMVSPVTGLPTHFSPARPKAPARNIRWSARLGNRAYGTPVVADGRVFVGTNNVRPRDPKYRGDRGVLMCLRESDGALLWQLVAPKIPDHGRWGGDRGGLGVCTSPTVAGDRAYVAHRGEILCLDVRGLANGNQGPFLEEAVYYAVAREHRMHLEPQRPRVEYVPGDPVALGARDADILWRFDVVRGAGAWPHDCTSSAAIVHGDYVYVGTGNGIAGNTSRRWVPYPDAPSVIVLDKRTGRLVAVDNAKIGRRNFHGQWSSPALGTVNGKTLIFYGGGDGYCYAFDASPEPGAPGKPGTLREVWRFDANPREMRMRDGKPLRYVRRGPGPCEIIGTPVFHKGRVYVTIGQDPSHGKGPGCLSCIDATGKGDISETGKIWQYRGLDRSLATVSVHEGLVYAVDLAGKVHCLDAETGEPCWVLGCPGEIWGGTLVADGKVYVGTSWREVHVLQAGRSGTILAKNRMRQGVYAPPVAANGVLYVASNNWLHAIVQR